MKKRRVQFRILSVSIFFFLLMLSIPSKAYAPRIPGLLERIQQPLYDRNTVATSGTGQLNYFQVPLGGTAAGAVTPTTQIDTNMDQGGSLPYPKNFEIHTIRLINQYGSEVSDLNEIYDNSWFRLFIGTKDYLVVNTFMLTAGVGLDGVVSDSTNITSVTNGRPDQRGIYVLAEPIDLIPQQNFRCEINFPTVLPLSSTTALSVYLDGFFKREVNGGGSSADPFGEALGIFTTGGNGVSARDMQLEVQPERQDYYYN